MRCRYCAQWNAAHELRCAFCGNTTTSETDATAEGTVQRKKPISLPHARHASASLGEGPPLADLLRGLARDWKTTDRGERPWLGPAFVIGGALMVVIGMLSRCR